MRVPEGWPRNLRELALGDHVLIVNDGEGMEARRFRQMVAVCRERDYRFVLMCDRQRISLLGEGLRTIDPEDFYFVPLDINWRAICAKAYSEEVFTTDHFYYLKAAGFLDRPAVIFVSHTNSIVQEPGHRERVTRIEELRPHWVQLHPCIYACSYLESDESGSPIPLARRDFQRLLSFHTHYLGATPSDVPRPLPWAGISGIDAPPPRTLGPPS